MHRFPARPALILSLTAVIACGATPAEQQALTSFFRASRLRDTTVLAGLAAVTFEPRSDGVVQQFEITNFGQERAAPDGTVSKEVAVGAQIRLPGGEVVSRPLSVAMRRRAGDRRWFITGVTPLPASRTSPAASSAPPS